MSSEACFLGLCRRGWSACLTQPQKGALTWTQPQKVSLGLLVCMSHLDSDISARASRRGQAGTSHLTSSALKPAVTGRAGRAGRAGGPQCTHTASPGRFRGPPPRTA